MKRPSLQSKSKRKSAARLSFGPGGPATELGADNGESAVVTPKKSNLSRLAIERNAERKASERLPFRAGPESDRPSYSKDYLRELQQSTPSTPKDVGSLQTSEDEELEKSLDVIGKFGPLAKLGGESSGNSAIPTDAEIREKKERRARLAKEQEYISLYGNTSDDENNQELLLRPKEKYAETRLVPDDEDIAEGFDDFVEDGKISLGRKAEREEQRQKRKEIAIRIADVEGSDADSDDSEADRGAAYDAAQTKAGTYGRSPRGGDDEQRPKTPPKITPIPELSVVLQQLRDKLATMEASMAAKQKTLDDLVAEKADVEEREVWIQTQLKETGERFEKLRAESGIAGTYTVDSMNQGGKLVVHRGLDHLGSTPEAALDEASDSSAKSK